MIFDYEKPLPSKDALEEALRLCTKSATHVRHVLNAIRTVAYHKRKGRTDDWIRQQWAEERKERRAESREWRRMRREHQWRMEHPQEFRALRRRERVIKALLLKTVANGCTPAEAEAARAKLTRMGHA